MHCGLIVLGWKTWLTWNDLKSAMCDISHNGIVWKNKNKMPKGKWVLAGDDDNNDWLWWRWVEKGWFWSNPETLALPLSKVIKPWNEQVLKFIGTIYLNCILFYFVLFCLVSFVYIDTQWFVFISSLLRTKNVHSCLSKCVRSFFIEEILCNLNMKNSTLNGMCL